MHTILIADPRYVMRTGLSAVFSNDPFVQSIKEASTPEDVQRQLVTFHPNIVFIHQSLLGDMRLLQKTPYIILASEPDMQLLYKAFQHRARGYLLENSPAELLQMALHVSGEAFLLDPAVTLWLLNTTCHQHLSFTAMNTLTPREREVFELIRNGLTNNEISQKLCISLTTVKKHATSLSQKLNLKRRSLKILSLDPGKSSYEQVALTPYAVS